MWKGLVCGARKAAEGWIMGWMDSGSSEGSNAERNADSGGSACEVSERQGLSGTG